MDYNSCHLLLYVKDREERLSGKQDRFYLTFPEVIPISLDIQQTVAIVEMCSFICAKKQSEKLKRKNLKIEWSIQLNNSDKKIKTNKGEKCSCVYYCTKT